MAERRANTQPRKLLGLTTLLLLVLPLVLLGGVIVLFVRTGGGLDFTSPAPIEDLSVERTRWNQV